MERTVPRLVALIVGLAIVLQVVPSPTAARTKDVKIRGYITELSSPTSFEVEDYRVTRDESVRIEVENASPDLSFKPEDLRVGALVEIKGALNEETNEVKARQVKIDLKQFRKFNVTTVLDRKPVELEKVDGDKWRGMIIADGRRIRVEPETQVFFKFNKTEKKEAEQKSKELKQQQALQAREETKKDQAAAPTSTTSATPAADKSVTSAKPDDDEEITASEAAVGATPLSSLADIGPGVVMTYEGTEQSDGSVVTTKVTFVRNEHEKGERSLWKELKIKEKPSDFTSGNPGELKVGGQKYKVLPNQEAQDYVRRIGERLIPAYQKNLPEGDPNKLAFRFTVVIAKGFNASAYPHGVIIIHDDVFKILENEAQLASVLAHEIAHATQEHSYRQLEHNKKRRKALLIASLFAAGMGYYGISNVLDLVNVAMVNGYNRTMENQADRVGLQYLADAGYDLREAPRVWKLTTKKYGDMPTFFWSSHDSGAERRSFQMLTIRNTFSELDFSALNKGDDSEFKRIAELAYNANRKNKKKITAAL